MKRLAALAFAFALFPAFADKPPDEQPPRGVNVTLEPGKVHEECMRLERGEKGRYYWKSNAPVDFNIHYHRGDEVVYPVKRERMRGDGGTFVAKAGEDYCWMWTAKAKASIEGQIELK